jgi:hypothetical protein
MWYILKLQSIDIKQDLATIGKRRDNDEREMVAKTPVIMRSASALLRSSLSSNRSAFA